MFLQFVDTTCVNIHAQLVTLVLWVNVHHDNYVAP